MSINIEEADFYLGLGKKIYYLRQTNRLTLDQLGSLIGVSYQQVHKYEIAENNIPLIRLKRCADVFGVPMKYFFSDIGDIDDAQLQNFIVEFYGLPVEAREYFIDFMRSLRQGSHN